MTFIKGDKIRLGMKNSEKHRKRISKALKGRIIPKEVRENMSIALIGNKRTKGHKLSEAHKRKISKALKGRIISKEAREKQSKSTKGIPRPKWRGKNCHFWKGGRTPENHKIRISLEMRLWREAVYARDNWTCQKCRVRNKSGERVYLQAHHIQNFAQFSGLRTSIENGITLCKNCHKEFHKRYGYKNNTKEQLKEFLKLT